MRPIDADAAKEKIIEAASEKLLKSNNVKTFVIACAMANMLDCEKDFPTIKTEPVKQGKWLGSSHNEFGFVCSECNSAMLVKTNYCHRCGTKMDLEE